MSEYVRNTVSTISAVNAELEKIQNSLSDKFDRSPDTGQANQVETTLDLNSNKIINVSVDPTDPDSLLTVGDADTRYVNEDDFDAGVESVGDNLYLKLDGSNEMESDLNAGMNRITDTQDPISDQDVATKKFVEKAIVEGTPRASEDTIYNTVSLMVADIELKEGDTVKTLGYHSAGSGGGVYLIRPSGSGIADGGFFIDLDNGLQAELVDKSSINIFQFGWTTLETDTDLIEDILDKTNDFETPSILKTLAGTAAEWASGNKSPIAIFGDSTTDGRVSTTNGVDEMSSYNITSLVGGEVPDGFDRDHDETEAPNCYVSVLQRMARDLYDNSTLRIYNAGWRGKQVADGWAGRNVYNAVYANPPYSDTTMIGINFGINDSDDYDLDDLRDRTYKRTKSLILDAYARGVQPFLITTNATVQTSDSGSNYSENFEVLSIVDNVKRQLATEFGLELIDLALFMYEYITDNGRFKTDELLPDGFHGSDLIHMKQAEYILFKHLSNGVIAKVTEDSSIDGMHPAAKFPLSSVWFGNSLLYPIGEAGGSNTARSFNVTDSFVSTDVLEQNLIDMWFWVDEDIEVYYNSIHVEGTHNPSLASSVSSLPQIELSSYNYSADSHKIIDYDGVAPAFIGDRLRSYLATSNIGSNLHYIGVAKKGLNRFKIYFNDGAGLDFNNWVSSGVQLGYLTFNEITSRSEKRSFNRNETVAPEPWVSAVTNPLVYYPNAVGSNDFTENTTNPLAARSYSLNKVGSYTDVCFKFDSDMPEYSGYIVAHGLITINTSSSGAPNPEFNATNGWNLSIWRRASDELRVSLTHGDGFLFSVPIGTLDFSDVAGKSIIVRILCDSMTSGKIQVLMSGGVAAEYVLSATELSVVSSGFVGGLFNYYSQNNSAQFILEGMSFRQSD